MPESDEDWLTSAEARKAMRISTCELSHLRVDGELRFRKQGNAYLYSRADVIRHASGQLDADDAKRAP
jgi:hypothetical protein